MVPLSCCPVTGVVLVVGFAVGPVTGGPSVVLLGGGVVVCEVVVVG